MIVYGKLNKNRICSNCGGDFSKSPLSTEYIENMPCQTFVMHAIPKIPMTSKTLKIPRRKEYK
jgi:hypothetical protein